MLPSREEKVQGALVYSSLVPLCLTVLPLFFFVLHHVAVAVHSIPYIIPLFLSSCWPAAQTSKLFTVTCSSDCRRRSSGQPLKGGASII